MHQKLMEIIAVKKQEVAELKRAMPGERSPDLPAVRDFRAAISRPGRINLISEIKFASPSAGGIRKKTDPCVIGRIYENAGASAISLLTDKQFFKGDLDYLPPLKKAVTLPVLRKDFIIDTAQVKEAFFHGADAILLIARILSQEQLTELLAAARELGMAVLTEIHDRDDLKKVLKTDADIIGINNRDLDTFHVNIKASFDLIPLVPKDKILISESGIQTKEDLSSLRHTGINAVLVGSALMSSGDISEKTREVVAAGIIEKEL